MRNAAQDVRDSMHRIIPAGEINEPVKQFLNGLDISSEPSMIEMDGRRVYIMARSAMDLGVDTVWSRERDNRRHALIDKKLNGSLSLDESVELDELQTAFGSWLDSVAPLPMEYVQKIHDMVIGQKLVPASNIESK